MTDEQLNKAWRKAILATFVRGTPEYDRARYLLNRREVLMKRRKHYQENGERVRADRKRYYYGNKEVVLKQRAVWKRRNPDKVRKYSREHSRRVIAEKSIAWERVRELAKKSNDASIENAAQHRQRWTYQEDLVVLDESLSHPEIAARLGRSLAATRNRRNKLHLAQRKELALLENGKPPVTY